MAMRNLTEPFILMRNNALQSKHIYAEQSLSDRMALVGGEIDNVELGKIDIGDRSPPAWTDALEETRYIVSRLRVKLDNLTELHANQLTRPTMDDTLQEERRMDKLSREIGRAFSDGHRQIQRIKSAAGHGPKLVERQLAASAAMALSSILQEMGVIYRSARSNYVQQINCREERNREFFAEDESLATSNNGMDSWLVEPSFGQSHGGDGGSDNNNDNIEVNDDDNHNWQNRAQKQESIVPQIEEFQESMRQAYGREQQVGRIVQSISDLNNIFKDLATMVHDQGSILDRIDYNIEQTQGQVQEAYKQLRKADSYQKASRKMYCIFVLATSIVLISFLFVVFKT